MDETQPEIKEHYDWIWQYRGLLLLITLIIVIACLGYMASNLAFIQQDPVKYCKDIFQANSCMCVCEHELSGNLTEAEMKTDVLHRLDNIKIGEINGTAGNS